MRVADILTVSAGRLIAMGDNGFLYSAPSKHEDPFQSLRHATLYHSEYDWKVWEIGAANEDLDEIASNLLESARRDHGFPYRPKASVRT
jgi:hypothetical protein